MNTLVESLKEHAQKALEYIQMIDKEVRARGLQNEQWFLDRQDFINQISVK